MKWPSRIVLLIKREHYLKRREAKDKSWKNIVVFSLTAGYFGATILKKVISGGRRGRDIQVWNIIR